MDKSTGQGTLQAPAGYNTYPHLFLSDSLLTVMVMALTALIGGAWVVGNRIMRANAQLKEDIGKLDINILQVQQEADKATLKNKYLIMLSHKDGQSFRVHVIKRISEIERELEELKTELSSINKPE